MTTPAPLPEMPTRQQRLIDAAFATGWAVGPHLPERPVGAVVRTVSGLLARRPGHYGQFRANLRQVVGPDMSEADLDDLLVRAVQSYARYWHEAFQLPSMDRDAVVAAHEVVGAHHVTDNTRQGRGVVVALTHTGNYDAASIVFTRGMGVPLLAVAERLKPESLYQRFTRYRESIGMQVAALTGDKVSAAAASTAHLRAGHVVVLLSDRDINGRGVPVELCGAPTTMPAGPAMTAIQTGAALVPMWVGFTETGWRVEYFPELDIPTEGRLRERVGVVTQNLADHFTHFFRAAPQDWHMPQPMWPSVRPAE